MPYLAGPVGNSSALEGGEEGARRAMEARNAAHSNVARKLDERVGSFRRLRQEADRA